MEAVLAGPTADEMAGASAGQMEDCLAVLKEIQWACYKVG
jgi:hypothetical protein